MNGVLPRHLLDSKVSSVFVNDLLQPLISVCGSHILSGDVSEPRILSDQVCFGPVSQQHASRVRDRRVKDVIADSCLERDETSHSNDLAVTEHDAGRDGENVIEWDENATIHICSISVLGRVEATRG